MHRAVGSDHGQRCREEKRNVRNETLLLLDLGGVLVGPPWIEHAPMDLSDLPRLQRDQQVLGGNPPRRHLKHPVSKARSQATATATGRRKCRGQVLGRVVVVSSSEDFAATQFHGSTWARKEAPDSTTHRGGEACDGPRENEGACHDHRRQSLEGREVPLLVRYAERVQGVSTVQEIGGRAVERLCSRNGANRKRPHADQGTTTTSSLSSKQALGAAFQHLLV